MSIKYSVFDFVWSGWDFKDSFAMSVVVQLAEIYIAVLCIDKMQTGEKVRCTALVWSSFITNTSCLYQYLLQDNSLENLDGLHIISCESMKILSTGKSSTKPQQHKISFYLLGSLWSLLTQQLWMGWYKLSSPCVSEVKIILLWCLCTFISLL